MPFNLSFFQAVVGSTPASAAAGTFRVGLDWPGLLETIGLHRPLLRKDQESPFALFSPCEWAPGHGPSKIEKLKFAKGVHFGAFDFDDLHESDVSKTLGELQRRGVALVAMSSFSHNGRRKYADSEYKTALLPGVYYQLRILFPFSRLVQISEWKHFWNAAQTRLFNDLADTTCKNAGRLYYSPGYREGSGVPPVYVTSPGTALDVDAFLKESEAPQTDSVRIAAAGKIDIELSDLRRVARALKASKTRRELGEALEKVVVGDAYAVKGTRHNVTLRLVREILDRYPSADPEGLADLFAPSLALMQPTKVDASQIVSMCEYKPAEGLKIDHTSRIAEAFNEARGDAYTPEDVQEMAETLGCRSDQIGRRWIVQHGTSFYVLCDGQYRHYSNADVLSAVVRDLAPAATVGVDIHEMTAKGMRRKTVQELMDSYGSVANSVVVDLAAQKASYDAVTRTFIEAPCPIRVAAKYHEVVDQWLRIFAGDKYEKLNDWLACVTSLNEPCAALYLEGDPGTGKSLLAHGVAKIFADRPTTMKEALGPFNESIVNCPVVFGDEQVPEDARGQIRTDEIREFIQARTRPLSRKYKPHATVKGALRLILAANNRDLLATKENLTPADLLAIVERVMFISVQPKARDFINSQKAPRKWVEDDLIAQHTMWLVENWEVERSGRFLVSGDSSELVQTLSTSTGLRAAVCQWINNYLARFAPYENQYGRDRSIIVENGRLLITSKAIHEAWTMYLQDKSTPPSPTAIGRALSGLSQEVYVHDKATHKTRRMREFRLEALASWSKEAGGYLDEQGVREAVLALERDQAARAIGTVKLPVSEAN